VIGFMIFLTFIDTVHNIVKWIPDKTLRNDISKKLLTFNF